MELLKPVLNGLKEIKEDLVDSYYTLFTSISSPDFFDKTMEKLVKDLHLDNEIAKGILKGIMEILPFASPATGFLGPVVLGVVDHYSKKNDGKITKDDVNKIIEEVKQTIKEIKTLDTEELNNILKGNEKLITDINELKTELNKLDLILEEVKRNGFKNLKEEIEETTDEEKIEEDRKNFYNGMFVASYNPYKYDFDIIREDTREIESDLEGDETNGILILGESGTGKTTILKRISYDFMLKGWDVYIKIRSDFDVEKLIENIKETKSKSLIVIDNASLSGEQRLRDLLENVWKQKDKNIKVLMSERKENWVDRSGNYIIGENELEEKEFKVYHLKLSEGDIREYFKKILPKYTEEEIGKFVKVCKEEFLGKPGEFIVLQIYLNTFLTENKEIKYEELLKRKCEAIEKSLDNEEEKELFYRVISVGRYSGKYPVSLMKKLLNCTTIKINELLNSLEKKGNIERIDEKQNIVTYHPMICKAFLENSGISEEELLDEFITNYEGNEPHNLFEIGTKISIDNIKKISLKEELAVKFLKRAIEIKEDFAEAHYNLGILYADMKRYEEAENEYKRAIEINDDAAAHNNIGNLYADMKRYEEAENEYKRAIEINDDAAAHNNIGNLYADMKRYEEAENEYKRAIEIDENYAMAHYNLGNLYIKLERFEEAEKEYKKAIEIKDDYLEAHNNLGALFKNTERFEEAEKEYKKAIEIDENNVAIHNNLGYLYDILGRFDEAEKEYKRAIEIDENFAMAHYNLGNLYIKLERFEEAEKEYKKAIEIKDDYLEAHNNLGALFKNTERFEEAEKEYKRAIEIKEDDAEAHNNLGNLYADMKRYDEAEKEYKRAIEINDDAAVHNNLGILYADMKRYDEAENEYKRAIEINENYAKAHYNLGNLYIKLERFEEAEKEYKKAIEINDDAEEHLYLALLYLKTNRIRKGKKELDIAYKLAIQNGRSDLISLIENYQKKINKQK